MAEKIKNNCFTPEEIEILQFTINQRTITIESQIKNYFKHCYYQHTEDELYDGIIFIKEQNQDLLKQISTYKNLVNIALNPYSHQLFKGSDISKDDDRLSASLNKSNMEGEDTNRSDIITNDTGHNQDLTKARSAKSETNTVKSLEEVWDKWQINKPAETIEKITDGAKLKDYQITTKEIGPNLPEPQEQKSHSYQYFDNQENLINNFNTTHTNTHSGSKDNSSQSSSGNNVSLSNVKGLKKSRSIEYSLGDNVLKVAQTELPKYRNMFWNTFVNNLFRVKWA